MERNPKGSLMSNAPQYDIDVATFWADPYPDLARMRREAPIAFVPQLGSTVFTRRDDIFSQEKRIAGPHYCAGAFASRAMVTDVALPAFLRG
jgi:hypothetical protein